MRVCSRVFYIFPFPSFVPQKAVSVVQEARKGGFQALPHFNYQLVNWVSLLLIRIL